MFTQRKAVIQQGPATTQLMFNHTQTSAATTLETGHQSSQLSLNLHWVSGFFSGYATTLCLLLGPLPHNTAPAG